MSMKETSPGKPPIEIGPDEPLAVDVLRRVMVNGHVVLVSPAPLPGGPASESGHKEEA